MATDCLVIGAGPAGLTAALSAALAGRSVLVLEKNDRPGRKLLLTGGGRCNLADPTRPALEALPAYGRGGRFLRDALAHFDLGEFLHLLEVRTEFDGTDGRTYVQGGASRMLSAFIEATSRRGVRLVTGCKVKKVGATGTDGFQVRAVPGEVFEARRLIVATGGVSYRATGSSGDGYAWAEAFGHTIDEPRAALGELATVPEFAELAGLTVPGVVLTAFVGKRKAGERVGTLLFTHHGVSGPAAVDLSLDIVRAGHTEEAELRIDFLPGVTRDELLAGVLGKPGCRTGKALEDSGLPARLVRELVRLAEIEPAQPVAQVSHKKLRALVEALKTTRLGVRGLADPDVGVVTAGGVATRDIEPRTMESRRVPGLYFAGEVLSPAGTCGGYNLLAAFATGWLAGAAGQMHAPPD